MIPIGALTSDHLGKGVIIHTDIQMIVILGSLPPEGMITATEEGNLYQGRLDEIDSETITISAFAGIPSDPEYRKLIRIEKKRIKEIKIK